ncbi:hypothetical protein QUA07_11940 [Microcoleus sp. T3_A4]|uniref:hypothetical protein n=1 Tax=Microcoleus sp. T3_A4 TaxID=2818968 RepID=UPI002FD0EAD7
MALVSIEQVWPAPQCPTAEKINNIEEGSSATDSLYGCNGWKEEGRRKKEEGRRKKEEGRRKKEKGRRKKEEGRRKMLRFLGD